METIHPVESPKPDYAFIYAKLARHVAVADALLNYDAREAGKELQLGTDHPHNCIKGAEMSVKSENRYRSNSIAAARKINADLATAEVLRSPRYNQSHCTSIQITWAEKRSVRNWMRRNADEYQTATELAEAAAAAFDFHGGDPLTEETHWIWDLAADLVNPA